MAPCQKRRTSQTDWQPVTERSNKDDDIPLSWLELETTNDPRVAAMSGM